MKLYEKIALFLYRCMHFFLKYLAAFDRFLISRIDCLKTKRADEKLPPIKNWEEKVFSEDQSWHSRETLIAHACGGSVRLPYTNAKEALLQSLQNGFRVIEVDVGFTTDDRMVCAHDAQELSYDEFMAIPIDGRFTPMGMDAFFSYLDASTTVIVDVKDHNIQKAVERIREIKPACKVVMQIFDESHYEQVSSYDVIYNLTFTQNYERVAAFCLDKGIRAVSVFRQQLAQDESWRILTEHNIKIIAHTVNELNEYKKLRSAGIVAVVTDYLIPADVQKEV